MELIVPGRNDDGVRSYANMKYTAQRSYALVFTYLQKVVKFIDQHKEHNIRPVHGEFGQSQISDPI